MQRLDDGLKNRRVGQKATWKAKLALLLFSLVVVCGIGEIGLRLIGYRPPEVLTAGIRRTYRVEPNGEFVYRGYLDGMFSDFATPVKLNGRAFHDVEHKPERANPNAFRLMVIGDSYVAALSCPLETTFFRRLEAKLKKEDLISPELGVYRVPLDPVWQQAYAHTAELLAQMKEACASVAAPLLIAGLSGPQAIGDLGQRQVMRGAAGLDPLQPARWLSHWCEANNVPFVPLEAALTAAGRRNVFWRHDGHLNPRGNEAIVDPIFSLVVEQMRRR